MTRIDDKPRPHLDIVATALRLKIASELGRHRLAHRALAQLAQQVDSLRPSVSHLAGQQIDDDPDLDLDALLAERHPAAGYGEEEADSVNA